MIAYWLSGSSILDGQGSRHHQHHHQPLLSLLQDKGFLQSSLLIAISCLSISAYNNKTSYLISPSSSLFALPYFTIPGLSFYYSDCPSISCLLRAKSCPCPLFLLIVVKMFATLVCSLIHDALFLDTSLRQSRITCQLCGCNITDIICH